MSDYFERSGSQCDILNANNRIEASKLDRVSFNTSAKGERRTETPEAALP